MPFDDANNQRLGAVEPILKNGRLSTDPRNAGRDRCKPSIARGAQLRHLADYLQRQWLAPLISLCVDCVESSDEQLVVAGSADRGNRRNPREHDWNIRRPPL